MPVSKNLIVTLLQSKTDAIMKIPVGQKRMSKIANAVEQ